MNPNDLFILNEMNKQTKKKPNVKEMSEEEKDIQYTKILMGIIVLVIMVLQTIFLGAILLK